jgi:hypothetical protein
MRRNGGSKRVSRRWGQAASVGTIHAIIREGLQRAVMLLDGTVPSGARAGALDEISDNNRQGGYLSVVDARSGAVWATAGPRAVENDSWALLLLDLGDRGLRLERGVRDAPGELHRCVRQSTNRGSPLAGRPLRWEPSRQIAAHWCAPSNGVTRANRTSRPEGAALDSAALSTRHGFSVASQHALNAPLAGRTAVACGVSRQATCRTPPSAGPTA